MPVMNCNKCEGDTFRVELRRASVVIGDATMSARIPAQVCVACGYAHGEFSFQVEQQPPPKKRKLPEAPPPDPDPGDGGTPPGDTPRDEYPED